MGLAKELGKSWRVCLFEILLNLLNSVFEQIPIWIIFWRWTSIHLTNFWGWCLCNQLSGWICNDRRAACWIKPSHIKTESWKSGQVGVQFFLSPLPISQVRLRRKVSGLSARPSWSKVETCLHHLRISKWDRGLKENLSFPLCCFVKQILLVAGGINQNDKYLSSVELLLPNQLWTKGGDLPRHWY